MSVSCQRTYRNRRSFILLDAPTLILRVMMFDIPVIITTEQHLTNLYSGLHFSKQY